MVLYQRFRGSLPSIDALMQKRGLKYGTELVRISMDGTDSELNRIIYKLIFLHSIFVSGRSFGAGLFWIVTAHEIEYIRDMNESFLPVKRGV